MTLTLIRHTAVEVSKDICYGFTDVDVASSFTEQAERAKQGLNISFDKIYASPLQRCRKLAEYLFSQEDIIYDDRLKELNFGHWEMLTWNEIFNIPEGKKWMDNYDTIRCNGGESFNDQIQRIKEFYSEIKHKKENVAIVCHAGTIRAFMCILHGITPKEAFATPVEYAQIITLDQ